MTRSGNRQETGLSSSPDACGLSPQLRSFPERSVGYIVGMPPLSPHLFWDVDRESIDPAQHGAWLAKRVLEHGRWSDWQALVAYYGRTGLEEIVTNLRSLEPRAFAFCRAWFDLPASSFRCYASTPFPFPSTVC